MIPFPTLPPLQPFAVLRAKPSPMKLSILSKLRTRTYRRREQLRRKIKTEPDNTLNLYRKRLSGQVEALDQVIADLDWLLHKHHDAWHTRRAARKAA